jgi:hypothetical protein
LSQGLWPRSKQIWHEARCRSEDDALHDTLHNGFDEWEHLSLYRHPQA